jgi:hypothetical protein
VSKGARSEQHQVHFYILKSQMTVQKNWSVSDRCTVVLEASTGAFYRGRKLEALGRFFHGAGYCSGSILSHRRMVTEVGRAAGVEGRGKGMLRRERRRSASKRFCLMLRIVFSESLRARRIPLRSPLSRVMGGASDRRLSPMTMNVVFHLIDDEFLIGNNALHKITN